MPDISPRKGPSLRPAGAKQETPDNPPGADVTWVAPSGEVLNIKWPHQSEWIWENTEGGAAEISPRLRIWVTIPAPYELRQATSDSAIVQRIAQDKLQVDMRAPMVRVSLSVKKDGKDAELGMVLRAVFKKPMFWLHSSCSERNIRINAVADDAQYLFAAARCEEDGENLHVYVSQSDDASFSETGTLGKPVESGKGWTHLSIKYPKNRTLALPLGTFRIAENARKSYTMDYMVRLEPEAPSTGSRFSISPGVGFTYLNYTEPLSSIGTSQLALTVKASARYILTPGEFDLGLSGFANFLNASADVTPKTYPAAAFYGINARFGYQIPLDLKTVIFGISGGVYQWGMLVANDRYGVKYLVGPQLFATMAIVPPKKRALFFYFKYALVADTPADLAMTNREVAVGGSLQLTSPQASRVWNLTLDLSDAQFVSGGPAISALELSTASLGVSTRF